MDPDLRRRTLVLGAAAAGLAIKPPVIGRHGQADAAEWRISPTDGKTKLPGHADFRGSGIFAMGAFTIDGIVAGVFVSGSHTFSKRERQSITLLPGLGIEGDAHCGSTVQHLSDRKKYPNRPNLRQLDLIQTELIEELNATG